jgi:hypothetical protein
MSSAAKNRQDPWETDEETIMQALCDAYNAGVSDIVHKYELLLIGTSRPMSSPRALVNLMAGQITPGLC